MHAVLSVVSFTDRMVTVLLETSRTPHSKTWYTTELMRDVDTAGFANAPLEIPARMREKES